MNDKPERKGPPPADDPAIRKAPVREPHEKAPVQRDPTPKNPDGSEKEIRDPTPESTPDRARL